MFPDRLCLDGVCRFGMTVQTSVAHEILSTLFKSRLLQRVYKQHAFPAMLLIRPKNGITSMFHASCYMFDRRGTAIADVT